MLFSYTATGMPRTGWSNPQSAKAGEDPMEQRGRGF